MGIRIRKNVIHVAESPIEKDAFISNYERRNPGKKLGFVKKGQKWEIYTIGK